MPRGIKSLVPRPPRERYYKATEAARMLGFKSTEGLRKLRVSGKIRAAIMPNGRWGFPESEIERYLTPISYDEHIKNLCK